MGMGYEGALWAVCVVFVEYKGLGQTVLDSAWPTSQGILMLPGPQLISK